MSTRRGILAAIALVAACLACAAGLARLEVRTSLDSFLPEDDLQLAQYQALGRDFGAEPIVVLVETGERTDPVLTTERMPDLVRLEGELAAQPGVTSVYGPGTTLNQIAGRAKDLLSELVGRRDGEIAVAQARARARGAGKAAVQRAADDARARFDARYGPLLVSGMDGGLPTLGNQRFIDAVAYGDGGAPRAQWQFVVPRPQAVAILVRPSAGLDATDLAGLVDALRDAVDGRRPAGTTTTVTGTAVIVAALSDRAVADAPRLGVLAVAGLGLCFAAATWIRRRRRLLPLALALAGLAASLSVFGWSGRPVTLGMIAFSSVLLGVGSYYPTYALTGASRRTVVAVGVASAASLATLALSPMPLVGDIGLLLGVGVLTCLVLAVAASALLGSSDDDAALPRERAERPVPTTGRTAVPVVALAGLALAAFGWSALPSIPVASEVDHFAGGLPALEQARHAEDVLGSSGEVDVVLSGIDTLTPAALAWMQQAEDVIARRHGDVMHAVLSPTSFLGFLGPDPTQDQVDAALRLLPEYLAGAVIAPDRSRALLTYGVRLDDVAGLEELRSELTRSMPAPPPGYEVQLVGLPLVLVRGEELLDQDRYSASLLGIAVAVGVLLLGLRRRDDAARAALAALVGTGWGFGLLALSGRGFDPVTIALGTLTVAVGAEFTVVLAEAARRGSRMLTRTVTLMAAASATGYLVLLASGLAAVRTFGAELALGVLLAYAAARLVVAATTRLPDAPDPDGAAGAAPMSSDKELVDA